MVRVPMIARRDRREQTILHRKRRLAGGKAGPVRDAEDVRIDRDRIRAERHLQDDVRGLAADARQRFQRGAVGGYLAVVPLQQRGRQRDDVLRLGVEQPDRADQVAHVVLAQGEHRGRGGGLREQRGRRAVDARVGRLRAQHDGDEERERIGVDKLAPGFGIGGFEAAEHLGYGIGSHRPASVARAGRSAQAPRMAASFIDLTMRPNAAMEQRTRWRIVAGVAAAMLLGMVRFVMLGAWPVAAFGVIDVGLLAWALAASAKAARAVEALRLDGDALTFAATGADGVRRIARIEPARARVELEPLAPRGNRLFLADGGQRIAVGQFLTAAEREEVRAIIDAGLLRWRRARRGG